VSPFRPSLSCAASIRIVPSHQSRRPLTPSHFLESYLFHPSAVPQCQGGRKVEISCGSPEKKGNEISPWRHPSASSASKRWGVGFPWLSLGPGARCWLLEAENIRMMHQNGPASFRLHCLALPHARCSRRQNPQLKLGCQKWLSGDAALRRDVSRPSNPHFKVG
jgi:hypothetical protein